MKNIETILQEVGLEVTDEQKKKITEEVNQNYKTVNDWQKQVDKVKDLEGTLETTKTELKKFDGVNVEELNGKIKELNEAIEKQAKDFEAKNADRDFTESLEKAIATAKGKNAKAIMALLDIDTLKASKNQQDDIKTALEGLSKAEDSKMLFGEPEPQKVGEGNPIGAVKKSQEQPTESLASALREHYTK